MALVLGFLLTSAFPAWADGVVRGKVLRLLGVGAGDTTTKVEIAVAPESPSALPDGSGNCQLAKPGSQVVTLYLLPANPSYKAILAILLSGAMAKKTVGLHALMNNGSCQVQNAYAEY